jgi:hypothetical protein
MDKGMPLRKELAMPELHKSAEKEATGNAPTTFPGMKKDMIKHMEKSKNGYCEVKNAK